MNRVLKLFDAIAPWIAKVTQWLCVGLIVLLCYEVGMRYIFRAPTMWVVEMSRMVSATLVAMGWSYVHHHQAHVRVDVIYGRLSNRWQSVINVLGALILFFPFIGVLAWRAASQALYSWRMNEVMFETPWQPPLYPIRAVVFLAILLLLLQGIIQFTRDVQIFIKETKSA